MGDRIALLNTGEIVQAGTAHQIYHGPKNLFVAGFFAELNRFDAVCQAGMAETPVGPVPCDGRPDLTRVTVAVRTVGLDVMAPGETLQPGETPGRVVSRRFLGSTENLVIAVAGTDEPLRARIRADELPDGVKDVVIKVRQGDIMLFESGDENA